MESELRRHIMMQQGGGSVLYGTENAASIITDIPTKLQSRVVFKCKIPIRQQRQFLIAKDGWNASGYLEYRTNSELGAYINSYSPVFQNDGEWHKIDWRLGNLGSNEVIIDDDGIVRKSATSNINDFLKIALVINNVTPIGHEYEYIKFYYDGGDDMTNMLIPKVQNGVIGLKDIIGGGFYAASGWTII